MQYIIFTSVIQLRYIAQRNLSPLIVFSWNGLSIVVCLFLHQSQSLLTQRLKMWKQFPPSLDAVSTVSKDVSRVISSSLSMFLKLASQCLSLAIFNNSCFPLNEPRMLCQYSQKELLYYCGVHVIIEVIYYGYLCFNLFYLPFK